MPQALGRPRSHYPSPRTPPRRSTFPTRDVLARQESVRDVARRVRARARRRDPTRTFAPPMRRHRLLRARAFPRPHRGFGPKRGRVRGRRRRSRRCPRRDPDRRHPRPHPRGRAPRGGIPPLRPRAGGGRLPRIRRRLLPPRRRPTRRHRRRTRRSPRHGHLRKTFPGDIAEDGGGGGGGLLGSLKAAALAPSDEGSSVPLRLAITAAAAAQHPTLGPTFKEMLENDDIDERMAVMLLLIVERRRGIRPDQAVPRRAALLVSHASLLRPRGDGRPSRHESPRRGRGAARAARERSASPRPSRGFASVCRASRKPFSRRRRRVARLDAIVTASASSASASTLDPSRPRSFCGRTRASGRARSLFR